MTSDDQIIERALTILFNRIVSPNVVTSSPAMVKQFLIVKLAQEEREIFGVLWLNAANAIIACEDLFFGTLTQAYVYPREVVKSALKHNAAGAIYFHNHPSSLNTQPSEADKRITEQLKNALDVVEVRSLDHIIVAGTQTCSFAEKGLM